MNVRLLRQIKRRILEKPRAFRMDEWTCGTAHCIAGWACVLDPEVTLDRMAGMFRDRDGIPICVQGFAERRLRLSKGQCQRLFFQDFWPTQFIGGRTYAERARLAAARIEHFINTKGAE